MTSQRVCAKMLEFVFGRSIATTSLEEVGICVQERVLEYTLFTYKSSRKFFSRRFTAGPERLHIAQRASRTAVSNSSSPNGLMKKADAPDFRKDAFTRESSFHANRTQLVEKESSCTR